MNITIKMIDWSLHGPEAREVRRQVFIEEQGVSVEEEWDDMDKSPDTRHLIAFRDNQAIGTVRLTQSQKIGRLAVLKSLRGHSVGANLLKASTRLGLTLQHERKQPSIYLHAQVDAIQFYEKSGFAIYGEEFFEAGIKHRPMKLQWDRHEVLERIFENTVLPLSNASEFNYHLFLMASTARRYIDILCNDLDWKIYCDERFVQAISNLARSSSHAFIRILVKDSSRLPLQNPLAKLSQQLRSKIMLRVLSPEISQLKKSYVLFDQGALVYFNNETKLEGFANYCAAAEAQHQRLDFDTYWTKHSNVDPNLASLHI